MDVFIMCDPIHGKVEYPNYIKKLISTEEFQRLRLLKQLGTSSRIFFSATHTRFEHCLGVCHLCFKLMSTLENNSGVVIDEIHKKCVAIAGLFHDIGHGPFSHMWECFVHSRNPADEWSHEQTSCDIVKMFFTKYDIKLSEEPLEHLYGVELIQALIIGDMKSLNTLLTPELMYLTEIVNNKFSNIDIDKVDYILRDAYYLKGNIQIHDFADLFDRCRVTKDINDVTHISYEIDDYELICNLFENRANLHIYCYQEPTIRGVEQMIMDSLTLAEEAGFLLKGKRISELHKDMNTYFYLDDSILCQVNASDDPKLHEAQEIIRRINCADFYKLIWTSPAPFNVNALNEKFGEHFFQIQKRIPLTSVFMTKNIIFHDKEGNRVLTPIDKLPKRGAYFEDYLIFSKISEPEHLNVVSEFIHNMKD